MYFYLATPALQETMDFTPGDVIHKGTHIKSKSCGLDKIFTITCRISVSAIFCASKEKSI